MAQLNAYIEKMANLPSNRPFLVVSMNTRWFVFRWERADLEQSDA